jgi:hypothetical protein
MFRIYQFDRKTAFFRNELLHGTHVVFAKTASQEVAFVEHLPNALYGPSPYKKTFVLVGESRRTGGMFWFFPEGVELSPLLEDATSLERERAKLLTEIRDRKGSVKPSQRGIRLTSKEEAVSLETRNVQDRDPKCAVKDGSLIEIFARVISTFTNYVGVFRVHLPDVEVMPGAHVYRGGIISHRKHLATKPDPRKIPHELYMPFYAAIEHVCDYTGEVWVVFENVEPCVDCGKGYMIRFSANGDESTLRHQCDPVPPHTLIPVPTLN